MSVDVAGAFRGGAREVGRVEAKQQTPKTSGLLHGERERERKRGRNWGEATAVEGLGELFSERAEARGVCEAKMMHRLNKVVARGEAGR